MNDAASEPRKIVIAGGSGFLGVNLANYLIEKNHEVVIVSRNPPKSQGDWTFAQWDGLSIGDWVDNLEGSYAIGNLAGRTVDCIKTPKDCDQILRSRVESTRVLGRAVKKLLKPPAVWIQMSTAHIYGDSEEVTCDENSSYGFGLAPFVGQAWEAAFQESVLPGMRQVILRTSFVLGNEGGALMRLAKIAKWGLGGTVGTGKQGLSWIHEVDMNRIFENALNSEQMSGVYIATAPNPVSNKVFMKELRKGLGVPIGLPAAEWMVRIGAPLVLNTDPELALYGRYCVSRRLKEEGFEFEFSELPDAMNDLFRN